MQPQSDSLQTQIDQFFNLNIIGILGVAYSVGAVMTLATVSTRQEPESLHWATIAFVWVAILFGAELGMINLVQVTATNPTVRRRIQKKGLIPHVEKFVELVRLVALVLIAAALGLLGEAVKVMDVTAGYAIQGLVGGAFLFGLTYYVMLVIWIVEERPSDATA